MAYPVTDDWNPNLAAGDRSEPSEDLNPSDGDPGRRDWDQRNGGEPLPKRWPANHPPTARVVLIARDAAALVTMRPS